MQQLKLFMLLLGCKPPGRHTEQHDVFFGIAASLSDLEPAIRAFWPEPERIHIDAWREVTAVDGYRVTITEKQNENNIPQQQKLFFINLGGYLANKFEEQHYIVLTVQASPELASKQAKETLFFKHNHIPGGNSHIDDKYGIDVDDIYQIEDILPPSEKEKYRIGLLPSADMAEDKLNLGYLKLSQLKRS